MTTTANADRRKVSWGRVVVGIGALVILSGLATCALLSVVPLAANEFSVSFTQSL